MFDISYTLESAGLLDNDYAYEGIGSRIIEFIKGIFRKIIDCIKNIKNKLFRKKKEAIREERNASAQNTRIPENDKQETRRVSHDPIPEFREVGVVKKTTVVGRDGKKRDYSDEDGTINRILSKTGPTPKKTEPERRREEPRKKKKSYEYKPYVPPTRPDPPKPTPEPPKREPKPYIPFEKTKDGMNVAKFRNWVYGIEGVIDHCHGVFNVRKRFTKEHADDKRDLYNDLAKKSVGKMREYSEYFSDRDNHPTWILQEEADTWIKILDEMEKKAKLVIGEINWYREDKDFDKDLLDIFNEILRNITKINTLITTIKIQTFRDYFDAEGI